MKIRMIATIAAACVATRAFARADPELTIPLSKTARRTRRQDAAKGRNSFTESQAEGRIGKAGYTNVSKLMRNQNGVWRGTAMKGGAEVNVGLDYKGNVTVL